MFLPHNLSKVIAGNVPNVFLLNTFVHIIYLWMVLPREHGRKSVVFVHFLLHLIPNCTAPYYIRMASPLWRVSDQISWHSAVYGMLQGPLFHPCSLLFTNLVPLWLWGFTHFFWKWFILWKFIKILLLFAVSVQERFVSEADRLLITRESKSGYVLFLEIVHL